MSEFRRYRLASGMTLKQAAKSIGVSIAAWSKWERGVSRPHPKRFKQLADKFGVDSLAFTRVVVPDRTSDFVAPGR